MLVLWLLLLLLLLLLLCLLLLWLLLCLLLLLFAVVFAVVAVAVVAVARRRRRARLRGNCCRLCVKSLDGNLHASTQTQNLRTRAPSAKDLHASTQTQTHARGDELEIYMPPRKLNTRCKVLKDNVPQNGCNT